MKLLKFCETGENLSKELDLGTLSVFLDLILLMYLLETSFYLWSLYLSTEVSYSFV